MAIDQSNWIFPIRERFKLSKDFLEKYRNRDVQWGGGVLGYVTYLRTYSRPIPEENRTENWFDTVKRIVEGCYTVQLNHCRNLKLPWDAWKSQKSAQKMFDKIFNFKFCPPGRGLWAMGTDVVYMKGAASLNNCAFTSTKDLDTSFSEPFCWLMDMSMFGVGVAFDTNGKGKIKISEPKMGDYTFTPDDSREGWVECVRVVLESFVGKMKYPKAFDLSKIRPKGAPIKTFGGIAPGPEPLQKCIDELNLVLRNRIDQYITSGDIVDIFNIVGKAVVSGGVRRTAELSLGDHNDDEYISLKDHNLHPEKMLQWRWASNNSVIAEVGMNYDKLAKQVMVSGEPGFIYLDNMRKYGRMKDGVTNADSLADGTNPCGEQTLEDRELCCLCDTYPANHDSYEEYEETLKYAYLYTKTVTLIPTHCERTNQVLLRNRRMGISQSGIVQSFEKHGKRVHLDWCDKGYKYLRKMDEIYSKWLCIPKSIKLTTVKPAGSGALLPGATPGIHFPHSEYYIRRIRIDDTSPLLDPIRKAGYKVERSVYEDKTWIAEFPIHTKLFSKSKNDISIWLQLENAALLQHYWSDNNISQTVTVKKDEMGVIKEALECFEDRLKSVSFLPLQDHKYEQAPYEEITKEKYNEMIENITSIDFSHLTTAHDTEEKFCDGDKCMIVVK